MLIEDRKNVGTAYLPSR